MRQCRQKASSVEALARYRLDSHVPARRVNQCGNVSAMALLSLMQSSFPHFTPPLIDISDDGQDCRRRPCKSKPVGSPTPAQAIVKVNKPQLLIFLDYSDGFFVRGMMMTLLLSF